MARKPTDPTKPTVNKDGKDSYPVHTIGDLVVLYHHLPQEKQILLLQDLVNGLQKASTALSKTSNLLRPVVRLVIRNATIRWIDDDKGRVTVNVKIRAEDEEAVFSKEL